MILRLITGFAVLAAVLARPASAGPTLLLDAADGRVLYAEDMDDQWHPASLTKMMTAYLVFGAIKSGRLKLDDKVVCSERALLQPPSKVGLPVGAEMTVDDALKALIIKSANDVAVMLAERVSGSEDAFVAEMNATARRLGMSRTQFVNPNGLPAPLQVTTARDLARLSRTIMAEYPEHAGYWAMPEMRLGKIRLASHNGLLRTFEGADGMKTGFICDSGFNVVATATRNGRRLIAIVLGETTGQDRTLRAASLLEHGFQNHGWKSLFGAESIDNIALSPSARSISSMRESVISWECGTARRSKAVAERKARIKAAREKINATKPAAAPAEKRPSTQGSGNTGSSQKKSGTTNAVTTTGTAVKAQTAGAGPAAKPKPAPQSTGSVPKATKPASAAASAPGPAPATP